MPVADKNRFEKIVETNYKNAYRALQDQIASSALQHHAESRTRGVHQQDAVVGDVSRHSDGYREGSRTVNIEIDLKKAAQRVHSSFLRQRQSRSLPLFPLLAMESLLRGAGFQVDPEHHMLNHQTEIKEEEPVVEVVEVVEPEPEETSSRRRSRKTSVDADSSDVGGSGDSVASEPSADAVSLFMGGTVMKASWRLSRSTTSPSRLVLASPRHDLGSDHSYSFGGRMRLTA